MMRSTIILECKSLMLLAGALLAAGFARPLCADILHVPGEYPTIQDALWAAHHADEIVVADGTYSGPGFYDLDFEGLLITLRSASGDPSLCTLDCQMMGRAFTFDNDETAEAIIEGFTISNAVAVEGAAFHIGDATPTIRDCIILDCYADIYGGGAYVNAGRPSFTNCTFRGCFSINAGGAVCAFGGAELAVSGCTFEDNNTFGLGGAIHLEGATLDLSGGIFDLNETLGDGGAIALEAAVLTADNAQFAANHADGVGGAIHNSAGNATLTHCRFESNDAGSADEGGGAIYHTEGELTLVSCTFDSNTVPRFGGALYAEDGTADLDNCTFTANSTIVNTIEIEGGGAIANVHYNVMTMNECIFDHNTAPSCAGALYNADGEVILNDCSLVDNSTDSDTEQIDRGGAIVNTGSGTLTLTGCALAGNTSFDLGGALYNGVDATARVENCTLVDNQVLIGSHSARGGAIENEGSIVVIGSRFEANSAARDGGAHDGRGRFTECLFLNNSADYLGGAINEFEPLPPNELIIINCRFLGNHTGSRAGAILTDAGVGGTVLIMGSTFAGNSATAAEGEQKAGAIHAQTQGGAISIVNCTFWANETTTEAGALYLTGDPTVHNCILWDNTPDQVNESASAGLYFCDIQDGWSGNGSNNIDADPLFIDPDGPDGIPGTEDDNLRLRPLSPCIDAADNTAVPPDEFDLDEDGDTTEPIPFDLDGDDRFVDDPATDDTGSGTPPIVDMGAYEFQACPADFDHDDDVDTADLLHLLGAWGTPAGDTDYDGDTDTADLLILLGTWGNCP